jgi:two-component system chemotaxis response regulator CheY
LHGRKQGLSKLEIKNPIFVLGNNRLEDISDIRELNYLVYDQDASQFPVMRMIMQHLGCSHLEFANSLSKAIELFDERDFDMAIITLRNRNEESWKFLRWLRSPRLTPKAGLPVLGLLTETTNPVLISAIRRGVNFVALKPMSSNSLHERVTRTLTTSIKMSKTPHYRGPCRRRLPDLDYAGPDRRNTVTAAQQKAGA